LREALAGGRRAHRAGTRSTTWNALERLAAEYGTRQEVLIRVHAPASPGTPTTRSPPARPTRSSAFSMVEAGEGDRAGPFRDRHCSSWFGLHCHVGSQLYDLEPFPGGGAGRSRRLGEFPVYNVGGGPGRGGTRRASIRRASNEYVTAVRRCPLTSGFGAGQAACCSSRAVRWWRTPPSPCTRSRRSSGTSRTWVAVRNGGMSGTTFRPDALRAAIYEAVPGRTGPLAAGHRALPPFVGKHCESGDSDRPRPCCSRTPRRETWSRTPATGAYRVRDGQQLQQRAAAGRWSICRQGEGAPSRCGARPTTDPGRRVTSSSGARHGFRVGPARPRHRRPRRSRELLPREAERIEPRHRACAPSSPEIVTRSPRIVRRACSSAPT